MKKTTTSDLTATNPSKEAKLVRELRGERSYREFENYLNESIPDGMPGTTTFASARNWESGMHPVNGACLMAWIAFCPMNDPRRQLAETILALRGSLADERTGNLPTSQLKKRATERHEPLAV